MIMKKLILTLGLGFCLSSAFSQVVVVEEVSNRGVGTYTKSGQQVLPQAGDFAISIDATPILKYAGNVFNGNTDNNNTNWFYNGDNIFSAPSIVGKYFLTDNTALRAKLHLGFSSYTDVDLVNDVNSTATPPAKVEDKETYKNNGLGLTVGYELRRGYGRLQGFFGPEVGVGISSNSTSWKYGNDLGSKNPTNRYKKISSGTTFAANIGGFVGVEYFVAPKISVGAEANLGIGFASTGRGKTESERWTGSAVEGTTIETGGESSIGFKTNYNGNLFVTFHF
jgi:hypothetical protein